MKVAEVKYEGSMGSVHHKGPSGEQYRLRNPMGGEPVPVSLDSVVDALHFDDQGSPFVVEWTAVGLLVRSAKPPVDALKELGYRQKQKVAKQFDIRANQSEEDLEEELQPYVEQLENKI